MLTRFAPCLRLSLSLAVLAVGLLPANAQMFTTEATAFQNNPEHTGAVRFKNFVTTPQFLWTRDLGAPTSYPVIANDKVLVTTSDGTSNGMTLHALNASTGATTWSVNYQSANQTSAPTYDQNRVYIYNNNANVFSMSAYDAGTGNLLWKTPLPQQEFSTSPPVARFGSVFVLGEGVGTTLNALNGDTGSMIWSHHFAGGSHSSPAVSVSDVTVSFRGPIVFNFDQSTGSINWNTGIADSPAEGRTPVVDFGKVYVRGLINVRPTSNNLLILDHQSGTISSGLLRGQGHSPTIPAIMDGIGYVVDRGNLYSFDTVSGNFNWTVTGSMAPIVTAPFLINNTVYVGDALGNLFVLDGYTGDILTSFGTGHPFFAPDERNSFQPLTGFGAANGMLVTPQGRFLSAFSVAVPEPSVVALSVAGSIAWVVCLRRRKRVQA